MKIAIVLNDDFSVFHFFKGLIAALIKRQHDVYVITPVGPYIPMIEGLGAKHIGVPMYRFISIFEDMKTLLALYKIFCREKFDIVHNITIKPNIYGSIVARWTRTKRVIGHVEGRGFLFSDNANAKIQLLRALVSRLYWLSFKCCDYVRFVNSDDLFYFLNNRVVKKEKAVLIKSMGIDLSDYSMNNVDATKVKQLRFQFGITNVHKVVTMITARMVWSKGVKEFIEASNMLMGQLPNVKFILVAPLDQGSPDVVPEDYWNDKESDRLVIVTSFRHDIKEIIALSDIVTLPSYYGEGVPRVLLEAMAMGKAIVTTDNVGCREVVEDGRNGFLVPVRNAGALANAINYLIKEDDVRKSFGELSRIKATREFDEAMIVGRILEELYGLKVEDE